MPETIWVSPPPGAIGPGPADEQMYVVDAIAKSKPYDEPELPPYSGPLHAPATPNQEGHFDHLKIGTRQFEAAHMYAVIRRVLDVWECYLGHVIDWHFEEVFERLELIPRIDWKNAQSGFGYIETGFSETEQGGTQLYCLNFDILAHEIGHSIIYSEVGWPLESTATPQYFGFQETAADMTALVAVLHFDSVVERLLSDTHGNLYCLNELNRIAELSEIQQVRVASNDRRMSHYAAGWRKEHDLSQPLTGALFDIFVILFHLNLLEGGLINDDLAEAAYASILPGVDTDKLQRQFDYAYSEKHHEFKTALLRARDYLGALLANAWGRLSPHDLTFVDVGHAVLDADLELSHGLYQTQILACFEWREIGAVVPGPKLGQESHFG